MFQMLRSLTGNKNHGIWQKGGAKTRGKNPRSSKRFKERLKEGRTNAASGLGWEGPRAGGRFPTIAFWCIFPHHFPVHFFFFNNVIIMRIPINVLASFFFFFLAAPAAYGGSQARGRATATVEATPSSYVVSHTGSPGFPFVSTQPSPVWSASCSISTASKEPALVSLAQWRNFMTNQTHFITI